MRTKIVARLACTFVLSATITFKAKAQQQRMLAPGSRTPRQMTSTYAIGNNYTYRLFIAPNKLYGYDILRNGKTIFHQPALQEPAGDKEAAITKKWQADKAVALAIEKIKKGIPPQLTREDIMQITDH